MPTCFAMSNNYSAAAQQSKIQNPKSKIRLKSHLGPPLDPDDFGVLEALGVEAHAELDRVVGFGADGRRNLCRGVGINDGPIGIEEHDLERRAEHCFVMLGSA